MDSSLRNTPVDLPAKKAEGSPSTISRPTSRPALSRSRRVTLQGSAGNVFLIAVKGSLGWWAGSTALLADAAHSLSDLLTDVLSLAGSQVAEKAADEDHPYGHGRFETITAGVISIILMVVGAGIVWQAFSIFPQPVRSGIVLAAAALSLVVKELFYHITMRAARELNSPVLAANAWHHRSDAASSAVVLIASAFGLAGWTGADQVAAVLVGAMIIFVGMELFLTNFKQLAETGADPGTVARISELLEAVEGVNGFHRLRTRYVGRELFVDVHILVSPEMTVREGHRVATAVENTVRQDYSFPAHVLVHIEPDLPAEAAEG